MGMKELEIFNRKHRYDFDFDIKNDIKVIEELLTKILEPQILSYDGLETIDFYIHDDEHFIGNSCIRWIYEQNKERVNEKYIRECLLKCAIEDKEWTEQRNKNSTGIFYRKITFLPEIQNMVCDKLKEYLEILKNMYSEMLAEKQKQKEETDKQRREWNIGKIFEKVYPSGGENGKDGYIDAEYTSINGEIIRMVSRDVFDFGCYSYPKRLEGEEEIFNKELWTEAEKHLAIWLSKFGEFHGIRM